MKGTSLRPSAQRQLLDMGLGLGRAGSSSHAQSATTIMRQKKLAARQSMVTLNEAFTEGARADDRLAKRQALSQAKAANGYTPKYVPALKKISQVRRGVVASLSAGGADAGRALLRVSQ